MLILLQFNDDRSIIHLDEYEMDQNSYIWMAKKTVFPFYDALTSDRVYLTPDVVRPIVFDDKEISVYYGHGGQWYAQRLE